MEDKPVKISLENYNALVERKKKVYGWPRVSIRSMVDEAIVDYLEKKKAGK